jgi:hypothetical protein
VDRSEIIAFAWAALFVIAVRLVTAERPRLATPAVWFMAGSIVTLLAVSLSASL